MNFTLNGWEWIGSERIGEDGTGMERKGMVVFSLCLLLGFDSLWRPTLKGKDWSGVDRIGLERRGLERSGRDWKGMVITITKSDGELLT